VRVSGHFLWDGKPQVPAEVLTQPVLALESADRDLSLGFPQSPFVPLGGQAPPAPVPFTIEGVLPGRYLIGVSVVAAGYSIEGADWRGLDLLSSPLAITGDADVSGVVVRLTSKASSVSGVVRDTSGRPTSGGSVIVFPASPEAWVAIGFTANRFRLAPTDVNGVYAHTQLPPGDYLIAAISPADRARWIDPQFLSAAAATATRLRIGAGATIAQDLQTTRTGAGR
jgi:hypothetical protein